MSNHLFLVGIDQYPKFKPPSDKLTTCIKDVRDFKHVLLEKYYFHQDDIVELYDNEASNINVQKALEDYSNSLSKVDNLIIYFSGHGGVLESSGRGFWITSDADEEDYSRWLPNETILELIKKISAKHIVIISDCCFASSILITNPSKSIKKELDDYNSRWALTSGRETTYCGPIGQNSFFADSIIKYLANSGKDVRFGTLVEYVKEKFQSDEFQQPQGHPIRVKEHDGGEFTFRVRDRRKLKDSEFRGYEFFNAIIKKYSRSNSIDQTKPVAKRTEKIGFNLLREYDSIKKAVTYYLFLYEGIIQSRTHEYLQKYHSHIFKRQLIIFLPKEKDQIDYSKRKSNIENLFKPLNIFYIDEFILEMSSKYLILEEEDQKYLHIKNFILPEYNSLEKISVSNWFNSQDQPVLIIKGTAGIGKSTYARYISDKFSKLDDRNVLFIESSEILEELKNQAKIGKTLDLYNLYKAAVASQERVLDQELFSLNLDAGNLLLVIDGLEEIISQAAYFEIDFFFDSIVKSNTGLGNTKIVITTRTYFWDESNIVDNAISTIELLPFDLTRTKDFFKKSFKDEKNQVKKAMEISDDFVLPDKTGTPFYHPFVLDIIKEIVGTRNAILFSDSTLDSKLLSNESKIDYIIGRICQREISRVKQTTIDKQIKFFVEIAVREKGKILEHSMKDFLLHSLDIADRGTLEAFKTHPFLYFNPGNRSFTFRYDFFENYFISHFITGILDINVESSVDLNLLNLFSQKLYHASETIKYISKNITSWNDENLLKVNDILQKIIGFKMDNEILRIKAISGLFNLALFINLHFRPNNQATNTKLILDLFGTTPNKIEYLVLRNINNSDEDVKDIKFDFSDLTFEKCTFDNYNLFWECKVSPKTYFINCQLRQIGENRRETIIPKENFIDCNKDMSVDNAFLLSRAIQEDSMKKSVILLEGFIKLFYKNGKFKKMSDWMLAEAGNYPKIKSFGFRLRDIRTLLLEHKVLLLNKDKKYNDIKLLINPSHSEEAMKLIMEGKKTERLMNVLKAISEKMK